MELSDLEFVEHLLEGQKIRSLTDPIPNIYVL